MTAKEQAQAVSERTKGTNEGFINFDGLKVKVKVIDSRKSFGRDDVLITPIAGSGEKWIDLNSLQAE
jgi:hypothetical protein